MDIFAFGIFFPFFFFAFEVEPEKKILLGRCDFWAVDESLFRVQVRSKSFLPIPISEYVLS